MIGFRDYALVTLLEVRKEGDRNPIGYAVSLQALGVDPSTLNWHKRPKPGASGATPPTVVAALTMAEAKKGLEITFCAAPEADEITIRG